MFTVLGDPTHALQLSVGHLAGLVCVCGPGGGGGRVCRPVAKSRFWDWVGVLESCICYPK